MTSDHRLPYPMERHDLRRTWLRIFRLARSVQSTDGNLPNVATREKKMSAKRSVLVVAAGGSICGALAGVVAGAVLGFLYGVSIGNPSWALDGALLGGVVVAVGGAVYGARIGRNDEVEQAHCDNKQADVRDLSDTASGPGVR